MLSGEPSSASKIVKIAHQQTPGLLLSNCYCPFLNCYCLTPTQISNYLELQKSDSSEICVVGKIRHEARSSMLLGEPSSASKIVKIAHQQTLGLLLSNCYCPFFNCYCLTSTQIFNYLELQNSDSSEIYVVGKIRHEATSSML